MKCKYCAGTGTTNWCVNGTFINCPHCGGTGEVEQTNFEKITKNENALAKWLSDRVGFCGEISCDECKINCASNDNGHISNAELWVRWLKQPHTNE